MPSIESVETAIAEAQADSSKVLGLTIGSHRDVKPGTYIPRADARSPPELSFPTPSSTGKYLVIGLDVDAPFPSFGILGPILHWIQPDLSTDAGEGHLSSSSAFVANYIGPAPPPGSAAHRYVFLLYEQPRGFEAGKYAPAEGKEVGNWARMRWDLEAWAGEVGLGGVVGVNYFVSN